MQLKFIKDQKETNKHNVFYNEKNVGVINIDKNGFAIYTWGVITLHKPSLKSCCAEVEKLILQIYG